MWEVGNVIRRTCSQPRERLLMPRASLGRGADVKAMGWLNSRPFGGEGFEEMGTMEVSAAMILSLAVDAGVADAAADVDDTAGVDLASGAAASGAAFIDVVGTSAIFSPRESLDVLSR